MPAIEIPKIRGEVWKNIIDFEGYYKVSNKGRILKLEQTIYYKTGDFYIEPKQLIKAVPNRDNYYRVSLSKNGIRKYCLVHRLVAQTFIPNPENKSQVNHKKGITTDNRASQLEWSTPKENTNHAVNTGLTPVGERCSWSKLKTTEVKRIRKLRRTKKLSFDKLSLMFNVSRKNISKIVNFKSWKHLK